MKSSNSLCTDYGRANHKSQKLYPMNIVSTKNVCVSLLTANTQAGL